MEFIVKRDYLVRVLYKVQGLTGRNNNLSMTENVLISAKDNEVTIKATDLETGYEGKYPADIKKDGSLTVNSKKIYEIIKEFPDENIFIKEMDNKKIRISNERITYDVVGNSSDNFPEIVIMDDENSFEIDSLKFKNMIKKMTIISGAVGEKRAHICGVFLKIENKDNENFTVKMVSTDANRLSVVTHSLKNNYKTKKNNGILIPKKGLNEVSKFIDSNDILNVSISEKVITVRKKYEILVIRLLEGEFPEFEEIIKVDGSISIEFKRDSLLKTLKRMSILTDERYNGLLFRFFSNKLIIDAQNTEYGESREEVDINFYSDSEINIAFNPRFLLDAVSVIEDDLIYINIVDERNPCIIEGMDGNEFLSVIMPMRI